MFDQLILLLAELINPKFARFLIKPDYWTFSELVMYRRMDEFLPYLDLAESAQIDVITRSDSDAIQYIKNPTDKTKETAVKTTPTSIRYIQKPTETMQLMAVHRNPKCICLINNPCERAMIEAVTQDHKVYSYLKNPPDSVKKIAMYAILKAAK